MLGGPDDRATGPEDTRTRRLNCFWYGVPVELFNNLGAVFHDRSVLVQWDVAQLVGQVGDAARAGRATYSILLTCADGQYLSIGLASAGARALRLLGFCGRICITFCTLRPPPADI